MLFALTNYKYTPEMIIHLPYKLTRWQEHADEVLSGPQNSSVSFRHHKTPYIYQSVLYGHGHGFSILFFWHRNSYDGCWHQRIHFCPELGLLKILFECTGHAHFAHLRKAPKKCHY